MDSCAFSMPRNRDDMQVNVAGIRRNIKNLAHNYSDAQVKVREATSNDPWGPSSTLMAEIADLTYNVMAFTEIMQMIWKRLNDHGKNWRHVYKALVLMEYLIKTGSEKVAMQCKENIYAIHTLKDFQYMEEGKDQGLNVREKAKQLVNLLKDDERLKNERARALKAKQRFAQSASAFGSDGALDTASSPTFPALSSGSGSGGEWAGARETELARPLTAGEEELQLQLALAMSREEAERDERRRRSDDVRLQLAISQSQHDLQEPEKPKKSEPQSHLLDLLDVNLGPPAPAAASALDPWGLPSSRPPPIQETAADTWSGVGSPAHDPWAPAAPPPDPWAPLAHMNSKSPLSAMSSPSSELEQFDALSQRPRSNGTTAPEPDPFDLTPLALGDALNNKPSSSTPAPATGAVKKSPSHFLGENSSLVNLDNLMKPAAADAFAPNPFAVEPPQQMFAAPPPAARLTMNEIKQQQLGVFPGDAAWAAPREPAWSPAPPRHTPNPFLS
ncbi:epsin-1 isoform X2 [Plutella xylostella]|uniref:epsin-1 isoform X2 n=1 Tax=Plutella xylostella TaxID=51655 RepID=UPI0020323C3C|nr:epsin-1 isoform X2 [Plutella xylostella]